MYNFSGEFSGLEKIKTHISYYLFPNILNRSLLNYVFEYILSLLIWYLFILIKKTLKMIVNNLFLIYMTCEIIIILNIDVLYK